MSEAERHELARILAKIEMPKASRDPRLVRRRRLALILMVAICVVLAAWIAILILTLHRHFVVRHWPAVWVGLDLAELAAFAATAWAAWKQRQIVIVFMIMTGTLLLCDAWFDLASSYGSRDFGSSLLEAILVELPLAFLMYAGARRLVRLTVHSSMRLQGISGPLPPLHRVPLFADGMEEVLPQRIREGAAPSP